MDKIAIIHKRVAHVIISLNECESICKDIIALYIGKSKDTKKNIFINQILLNNSTVNFHNKFKLLLIIARNEGFELCKEFSQSMKIIMSKRNVLAHSDTLDIDYDMELIDEPTDDTTFVITHKEPETLVFNGDGNFNYQEVNKVVDDFNSSYFIAKKELIRFKTAMYDKLKVVK